MPSVTSYIFKVSSLGCFSKLFPLCSLPSLSAPYLSATWSHYTENTSYIFQLWCLEGCCSSSSCTLFLFVHFVCLFGGIRSLMLARQALFHLSQVPSPFHMDLDLTEDHILPIQDFLHHPSQMWSTLLWIPIENNHATPMGVAQGLPWCAPWSTLSMVCQWIFPEKKFDGKWV
jgi:hypothetical protein